MYKFLNKDTLSDFIADLTITDYVSLDTETTSLDTLTCKLLLFQVMVNKQIYIFNALEGGQEFFTTVITLIESSGKTIIAHNSKYDLKVIHRFSNIMLMNVYDTMIVERVITNGLQIKWPSLVDLVEKYPMVIISKEERESFYAENFTGTITNEQLNYACRDVMYLEDILTKQMEIVEELKLKKIVDLEMKLVPVVATMEITGVLIDVNKWMELDAKAKDDAILYKSKLIEYFSSKIDFSKYENALEMANEIKITELFKRKKDRVASEMITGDGIKEAFANTVNLNSHNQMKILLALSGVPVKATNEKILTKYKDKYEVVQLLLSLRGLAKKISTYGLKFLENIHPNTGRIHSDFDQVRASSGRFGSSNPNLQNIPAEKEYRESFIASKGNMIVAVDYSQQEYRIAGEISNDTVIIDAYQKGVDMHTVTASLMYDKEIEDVTKDERNSAKTMNYAILYGTTDYGLAKTFGVTEDEARELRFKVMSGYKRLFSHKSKVEDYIVENHISRTLMGRIRVFERNYVYSSGEEYEKAMAKIRREGYNHVIQGTAAEMSKLAMINVFYNNPFGDKLKMIMPEHDEIVAEVSEDIVDDAYDFISEQMVKAGEQLIKKIPTVVEGAKGYCWQK